VSPAAITTVLAGRLELRGELADRRRLARAVHAHHQHHLRLLRIERQGPGDGFHHPGDLGGEKLLDVGGAHHPAIAALGHVGGDAHGGLHAHIGGDQKLLELFEHVVVERAARRGGPALRPMRRPRRPGRAPVLRFLRQAGLGLRRRSSGVRSGAGGDGARASG
jgi:hypothetical protein